jgi:hypothetical protein
MPGKQPRTRDGEELIMTGERAEEIVEWQADNPEKRTGVNYFVQAFMPFEAPVIAPAEPMPTSVIGFTKRYREAGPAYSFVAVHVGRLGWYLTGPNYAGTPMVWDDLLNFIGGPEEWARVGVATAWLSLPDWASDQ